MRPANSAITHELTKAKQYHSAATRIKSNYAYLMYNMLKYLGISPLAGWHNPLLRYKIHSTSELHQDIGPSKGANRRMNGSEAFINRVRQTISLLRHPTLNIYSMEGESSCGHLNLLVADDGTTLSYIRDLVFPDGAVISRKRSISALNAPSLVTSSADVVIVGANILLADSYAMRGFYLVPKWVRLFLPVEEEPYARLYNFGRQTRKYFKWMIKKVEDAGFECELVTDSSWLDTFYYDMYCPYAKYRYGDSAVVHSYSKIKKAFLSGAGIVAKQNGKPVAGTVVSRQGDDLRIPHVGVLGADPEPVRDGALFAMDYFIVQYAHSTGYKYIDFGHSRPFLSDGPLKYKLNWHMEAKDDDDGVGMFAIAVNYRNEQASNFLQANPFFYLTKQGLRVSDEQL